MEVLAPAKVNLFLEVVGKRPDGYHEIETIFQAVTLFDKIFIEEAKELVFSCDSKALPQNDDNLAFKAAKLFKSITKTVKGAQISLEKVIPLGAGLGGGSSDAAAVLRGLNEFWAINMSPEELRKIALQIGADVPFFIDPGVAIGKGIGEKIEKLEISNVSRYVLIYPGFQIATKDVYADIGFPLTNIQKISTMKNLLIQGAAPQKWGDYLYNRLEQVVLKKHKQIQEIKSFLSEFGIKSLMSGSGSTVFGLLTDSVDVNIFKAALKKKNWQHFIVDSML